MNLAAPHIGFVIAAYGIAFVVIGSMIVATLLDYRGLKTRLEKVAARAAQGGDSAP
jgi:heme exporter protein CcmD